MNELVCDTCGEHVGYEIGSCPRNVILCDDCANLEMELEKEGD